MRDPLRRLEHELEIGGNFRGPCFQNGGLGHAIERVVDLDRSKTLAVEAEHLLVRQALGIKRAFPFLVGIAAGADVEVHRPLTCRVSRGASYRYVPHGKQAASK